MTEFLKSDHQLVRDYVTALDHLQYKGLPEDVVSVLVTHSNLPTKLVDLRFNLHSTIEEVKGKLYTHVGTPAPNQRLILKSDGKELLELIDNNRMLGFYSVESGMEIHIIDTDPFSLSRGGGLTDTSLVEKYKMSDEDYDKRQNTLRSFMKAKKAEDPNFRLSVGSTPMFGGGGASKSTASDEIIPIYGPDSVDGILSGSRCEVMPGRRRGTVKFVGEIEGLRGGGFWVGVEFDEPVGLCDGKCKGVEIFECKPNYGSFTRGKNVTIGEFPVRNLLEDSDDDVEDTGNLENENEDDEI